MNEEDRLTAVRLYEESRAGLVLIGYYFERTGLIVTEAGHPSGRPGNVSQTKAHRKRVRASIEPDFTFRGDL